jgi:hypothetical protein
MGDIKLLIDVDASKGTAEVRKFEESIEALGRQAPQTESGLKSLWGQVSIGSVVAQATARAAQVLTRELVSVVAAAAEQERVDKALAAAIDITGRSMGQLYGHFKEFAAEQQKVTVYGDEQIQMVQTLLLQMTRLDRDGIDKATKGAMGLASTLGMDLQSAALLVTKAIEGNTAALSRYGIRVNENLPPQERTAALMEQLLRLYSRSTAEVDTYQGRMKQLKNAWEDFKETLGSVVVESGIVKTSLGILTESLRDLNAPAERSVSIWARIGAALSLAPPGGVSYNQFVREAQARSEQAAAKVSALADAIVNEVRPAMDSGSAAAEKLANRIGKIAFESTDAEAAFKRLKQAALETFESETIIEDWPTTIEEAFDDAAASFNDYVQDIISGFKRAEVAGTSSAKKTISAWDMAGMVISGLEPTLNQFERNREIAVDNEYKKKLAAINANISDEEARQQAIMALEAEYQVKRTEAQRAGAKASKAVALMEAIVNTAAGVARAFKDYMFPFSTIVASIVGVLGAVQVAAIAAQPIPLAAGAVFDRRTRLISETGTAYEVGEGGEPEILAPESEIRSAVRQALQVSAPSSFSLNVSGPLIVAQGLSEAELQAASARIFDIMQTEARRRGYRLNG